MTDTVTTRCTAPPRRCTRARPGRTCAPRASRSSRGAGQRPVPQRDRAAVGRWIIPCMETPDGTIIQDGADIIDHFERGPGQSLREVQRIPDLAAVARGRSVFELFGGEGLLRPAMHYRWNFDEREPGVLDLGVRTPDRPAGTEQPRRPNRASSTAAAGCARRQRSFGVTPESQPLIETAFHEWLDLFEAHLVDHPYLLGNRPTIGDYGLIAAMWAHLYRDPAPTHGCQAAGAARRPLGRADDDHRAVPARVTTVIR